MKQHATKDPRDAPAYTAAEAALYLQLPASTVRSWTFGRAYRVGEEYKKFRPIIRIAYKKNRLLSFKNLVELHVVSALRKTHKIRLEHIRKAVQFVEKELKSPHPLLEPKLAVDKNNNLLVEALEHIFNVSKEFQVEMKQVVYEHLQRVERDHHGIPTKLFPIQPGTQSLRAVEINPLIKFGRPCLKDRGIPIDVIQERFLAGEKISEISNDYDIEVDEVEAAIRFASGKIAA